MRIFNFEINRTEIIGLCICVLTIVLDAIFLYGTDLFYFILGIAFIIAGFPFFIFFILESNMIAEKDAMFLEFSRNLVENVKAGTPISKSVINLKTKNYGALNSHVQKLANQIALGIPIKTVFETFARDIGSKTISRAINILSESQKAGGEVEDVLESVVNSVAQIEKLKKDRLNAMYGLVVQGYIIFFIFIIIMVVMEFKILPIASGISVESTGGASGLPGVSGLGFGGGSAASPEELARPFLWLLIVQGFFTGLIIGKLSEGNVKAGFKHFFILTVIAVLINTGLKLFIG